MSRLLKLKRQVIAEANKRVLNEQYTGNSRNMLSISNEGDIYDHMEDLFKIDKDSTHKKTFFEKLLDNAHIHFNPSTKHLSLLLSHMGKFHDITLEVDGEFPWGEDGHHYDDKNIELDLHNIIGVKAVIPLHWGGNKLQGSHT